MARMLTQVPLPLLPGGAAEIAPGVGVVAGPDGGGVVWVHGLATFAWDAGDEAARRLAAVQLVQRRAHGLAGDARLPQPHAVEALGQVEQRRVTPSLDVQQQRSRLHTHLLGHRCPVDKRAVGGGPRCWERGDRDHGMSFSIGSTRIEVAPAA